MYVLPLPESSNDTRGSDNSMFWKALTPSGLICKTGKAILKRGLQVNSASLPSITVTSAGSIVTWPADVWPAEIKKGKQKKMVQSDSRADTENKQHSGMEWLARLTSVQTL